MEGGDRWTGAILTFDEQSTRALHELQLRLPSNNSIGGMFPAEIPPHLTLFEHDNIFIPNVIADLRSYCANTAPFDVMFCSIGYFPSTNVLFLNPKESGALRQFRCGLVFKKKISMNTIIIIPLQHRLEQGGPLF